MGFHLDQLFGAGCGLQQRTEKSGADQTAAVNGFLQQ
jgi:hypothetical protein